MPMMDPKQISQSWTVSEILRVFPEAKRVFLEHKTLCFGCYMDRFCTVSDVARVYNLDAETLVHELQQSAVHTTDPS